MITAMLLNSIKFQNTLWKPSLTRAIPKHAQELFEGARAGPSQTPS